MLITRFAPAPTGFLHLGHLLSSAYVFGVGRSLGAKVLLRIEDHDTQRSRKEYEQAIFEDLDWIGFHSDNWSEITSAGSTQYRQQSRLERYEEIESRLPTYPCNCSRKQIAEAENRAKKGQELRYPGTCRKRVSSPKGESGHRLLLSEKSYSFTDYIHGECQQTPSEQCGDLLIRDRNGNYTYNFAVAIDDFDQGINLVIRGDDLFHCTGRQLAIREMLYQPCFENRFYASANGIEEKKNINWLHHSLIVDEKGEKLGKSHGSSAIRERRALGEAPEKVLGDALFQGGVIKEKKAVSVEELPSFWEKQKD